MRLLVVLVVAGAVADWYGLIAGLAVLASTLLGAIGLQLWCLYRLGRWLDDPVGSRLPDGWGAWSDIFSRLYKLRRDDERNQAELA
ncbi:DUF3329 domain-containing protein, partial [Noviherbaspirillum humi]|uniref:DUF3329 domain-containing protein n=1 Tax=Noviherbaspirillum humi TaxID=1688639 RepID=UPI001FE84ED9